MKGTANKTFFVRVPMPLGDRLESLARKENNTLSAVTRRLLSAAIDREDELAAPRATPGRRKS